MDIWSHSLSNNILQYSHGLSCLSVAVSVAAILETALDPAGVSPSWLLISYSIFPPLLSSSPRSCWIHPVTVRSHLIYHFISVHHPHLYHKKWSAIPQAMIISLLISPWFSHDFCRRKIPAEIHPDLDNFNANEAHQRQLHLFLQEAPDAPEPKPGRWRMAWDSMGNGKKWWFKSRKMVV